MSTKHEEQQPETALCMHCAAPTPHGATFCRECGCPLTFAAASMWYEAILAQGFIWREGSSKPWNATILIGMWLLFGPQLAMSVQMFFHVMLASMNDWDFSLPDALWMLLLLVVTQSMCVLYGCLLYKTTRNYLKLRREREDEGADEEGEA